MWAKIKFMASSVWAFIEPTVKVLLTEAGRLAMRSALVAVRVAAEKENLSGKEKFALAFDLVQADLVAKGKTLLVRHINKVVELAYEHLCADEA
jgi:hypothetical protein